MEGPVALLLTGAISHGRFRELMQEDFPEAGFNASTLHPILMNIVVDSASDDGMMPCWDVAGCAADYCRRKGMPDLVADVLSPRQLAIEALIEHLVTRHNSFGHRIPVDKADLRAFAVAVMGLPR